MSGLVLDTNVVLDIVVFDDPGVRPLRAAIERGEAIAYTCEECLEELRRVLDYPKFRLSFRLEGGPEPALARYASLARRAALPASPAPQLPRCSDRDDQKFLALALAVGARHLVTKDKALLQLAGRARRHCGFDICTPASIWDNPPRHGA